MSQTALKLKTKLNSKSGFSLLEVIISLFIIGLILALYQAVLGNVRLIQYAKDQEIALRVANNKMEELRAGGYTALPASGSFSDSQLNALSSSTAAMAITDFNATTKEVLITIQWREAVGTSAKNISLTTLITKTGGL
ncbi:prepilin-type N-terminal cleavage/methylation domain-containing protein [bacterium]|nr:MAG: prepilin-type N-terminal cleavage/methylation domain-containing protein [bacterium]